jgi:hypothetical protein
MVDLDVAGLATIGESGVAIERAPEGITFQRLDEGHERLYSLVGWDEKFAAHNAAVWQHGLLVHVPKGVELDKPLYVRITSSANESALIWRLLVIADPGARFTLVEEIVSSEPELHAYTNEAAELFVGEGAKLEYVSLQNLSRETWHFASHHARVERDAELDWVSGGFGSKKGKVRIQNDLAGQGATSRVTEHDLRLRLQRCPARPFDRRLARDDPRRARRTEDERVPGEPQPDAVTDDARSADPGPRDPGERRAVHARRDRRSRRPRAALLPDGARPFARRG